MRAITFLLALLIGVLAAAQQQESLGDIARRLRAEKEARQAAEKAAEKAAEPAPVASAAQNADVIFTANGITTHLTQAFAVHNNYEGCITVILSDGAVTSDEAKWESRMADLADKRGLHAVEIDFNAKGQIYEIAAYHGGLKGACSFGGFPDEPTNAVRFDKKIFDGQTIAGRVSTGKLECAKGKFQEPSKNSSFQAEGSFTAQIAVESKPADQSTVAEAREKQCTTRNTVNQSAAAQKAPVKALMAFGKAVRTGRMDAVKPYLIPELTNFLVSQPADDRKMFFTMLSSLLGNPWLEILDFEETATTAMVTVGMKDSCFDRARNKTYGPLSFPIPMVLIGGTWKMSDGGVRVQGSGTVKVP